MMARYNNLIILFFSVFCVKSELLNLHEGSKCSRKGVSGQCVSIYRCLSSFADIQSKDFAPICSFRDKEPIVCCTDCELVNDTRKMIWDSRLGLFTRTGRKARDKCTDYILKLDYPCKSNRRAVLRLKKDPDLNCYRLQTFERSEAFASVGGQDAYREEFPHMALLGYGDSNTAADWLCGGSVISEKFVLTAAHCISSPTVGTVKYIALGILKRSDPPELWQKYNVKRIIPHPEYKPPSKYHDIALLETETPISFENQVRPACLHTEGEPEETASATGWGALGHRRQLSDVLQAVYVSRFEEEECSNVYPPHRHLKNGYNHTTQMCYGDRLVPRDTCEGDSGGPLQSSNHDENGCVYTILGVTSYGRQCGIGGGSGIYTRVYHYVPWIESVVWPED